MELLIENVKLAETQFPRVKLCESFVHCWENVLWRSILVDISVGISILCCFLSSVYFHVFSEFFLFIIFCRYWQFHWIFRAHEQKKDQILSKYNNMRNHENASIKNQMKIILLKVWIADKEVKMLVKCDKKA